MRWRDMLGIKILICDDMVSDPICNFPMWEVFKDKGADDDWDKSNPQQNHIKNHNSFHNIKISKKV